MTCSAPSENVGGLPVQGVVVKDVKRVTLAPESATSPASVVAGPHSSGLASGANAPPLKCRITLLNGAGGFSVNVVRS